MTKEPEILIECNDCPTSCCPFKDRIAGCRMSVPWYASKVRLRLSQEARDKYDEALAQPGRAANYENHRLMTTSGGIDNL